MIQSKQERDLLDVKKLPFAIHHPIKTCLVGYLSPALGLLLEGFELVPNAIVISGVVVGVVSLLFSSAENRCEKLSSHTSDQAKQVDLKIAENNQAIMNAHNLMHRATNAGELKTLVKLKETVDRCEARDQELKDSKQDLLDTSDSFSSYSDEASQLTKVFSITALVITSLGGAYLLICRSHDLI